MSEQHNQYQMIRQVLDHTGYRIKLGMFEEIKAVSIQDECVMVTLSIVEYTETTRQFKITDSGTRIIVMTSADGGWNWDVDETEIWTGEGWVTKKFDVPTVRQQIDRLDHEQMCYRPGTARQPMDNYAVRDEKRKWSL